MKRKLDTSTNNNTQEDTTSYINYIKLNQTVILFRNWIKHKNVFINKPCDEKFSSLYSLARLVNEKNPLPLMMPEVYFHSDYCSSAYESWEELYLKDDLFIAMEYLYDNRLRALSLETVFLANKYNGFLRTELRYDDVKLTVMGTQDKKRFLAQLRERYPSYYKEYVDAQPSKDEDSLTAINRETLNLILNAMEVMLVLSCHKGGLRNTTLPNSSTDLLSAYGYEILRQTLSEHLTKEEREAIKKLWAKNIRNQSEKTVEDLLDSALKGACTTTLGLYWLGLIKEVRQNFSLSFNKVFVDNLYDNFVSNNPDSTMISKTLFSTCIRENLRYIAAEMLNPEGEYIAINVTLF
jgi:hypothetical protein